MEILRDSETSIKLQFKDAAISVGLKPQASSIRLGLMTDDEIAAQADERVFQGAGEYETAGVMIDGVATGKQSVSYHIVNDGYQVACLNCIDPADITDAMIEQLQPSGVLCVWSASQDVGALANLIARFEARVIIPVKVEVGLDKLEAELQLKPEVIEKLKLSNKDFVQEPNRLVSLS